MGKCEKEGNEILISCQDTGPGIPDEIKDKIFDLFYTTKDGGTGIGLSFAQKYYTGARRRSKVRANP